MSNSAELDQAILESRSSGYKHREEIAQLSTLGHQLDRASDVYDTATEKQKRLIAEQQRQINKNIKSIDC